MGQANEAPQAIARGENLVAAVSHPSDLFPLQQHSPLVIATVPPSFLAGFVPLRRSMKFAFQKRLSGTPGQIIFTRLSSEESKPSSSSAGEGITLSGFHTGSNHRKPILIHPRALTWLRRGIRGPWRVDRSKESILCAPATAPLCWFFCAEIICLIGGTREGGEGARVGSG